MNAWGELANAHGASRDALAACVVDLARAAVAVEGLPTLSLPERGTAVTRRARGAARGQGHRPSVVRIWADRAGQGYAGTCDFAGGAGPAHRSAAPAASGLGARLRATHLRRDSLSLSLRE